MHWADVAAQALAHKSDTHVVSTGITPSGEFHIGHLREILTGDMIARAAKDAGLAVDFIGSIRAAGGDVGLVIVLVNKTTRNEIDGVPLRGMIRAVPV